MKQIDEKTNVMRILDGKKIEYNHYKNLDPLNYHNNRQMLRTTL